MQFGWNKVTEPTHFIATCLVALGTLVSMTWILASNSWMQTPQGHEIVDGIVGVVPVDWFEIIFTPLFPYRLVYMDLVLSFVLHYWSLRWKGIGIEQKYVAQRDTTK